MYVSWGPVAAALIYLFILEQELWRHYFTVKSFDFVLWLQFEVTV